MRHTSALLLLVLVAHAYSAPQLISWKDGKLGVNFGGYHAAVGLGGAAGSGGFGGLHAEAGTPYGQGAVAGLGGAYGNGNAGGLYAGATATQNVHASAGLAGVANSNAAGAGFAQAQAGNHYAASGMIGESSAAGSTGFKYSGTKDNGVVNAVIKETDVSVVPVAHKKVHTELKLEAANEVNPVPLSSAAEAHVNAKVDVNARAQPATVLVKEVYVEPQPQIVEVHKFKTHYKPHRHHVHKTYIGGYVGGGADVVPSYQPIQKRIDVGVEGAGNIGTIDAGSQGYGGYGGQTTFTKEVTVARNPTFFQDIFNIPISTLQSVGNLLSNSAANTKVSVQKSATIQAETDDIKSKHVPLSSSSSSASDTHISVETPSVSSIIDNIFAIPINTLGAVNKFLENNVPARKRIQVQQDGSEESANVRLGPHARRRANKQKVIYVQQESGAQPITEAKPEEAH